MNIHPLLIGAILMSCFTISLFFLRFWKTTHDRFFLFFALSFLMEGAGRLILTFMHYQNEYEPLIYLIRIFAFLMIIFAIIDKNWVQKRKGTPAATPEN